ncbi:MAG: energy transducer TonB [Acidobacteriota bacterium]
MATQPIFDSRGTRRPPRRRTLLVLAATVALAMMMPGGVEPAHADDTPPTGAALEAMELLKSGKFKAAAKRCTKARSLSGKNKNMCDLVVAIAKNRSKDYSKAEKAAQRLVDADPGGALESAGYRELGLAIVGDLKKLNRGWPQVAASMKSLENLERAEKALRRSIELVPNQPGTRIALADVLTGLLVYHRRVEYEGQIRQLLFEYLDREPEGAEAEWAREITCTSKRYEDLRWDPRSAPEEHKLSSRVAETTVDKIRELGGIGEDEVTKPVKLSTSAPQYANLARLARLQGQVIIQAVIDTEGKVHSVRPLKSMPLCLTEEAMLAVQEWTFKPAKLRGEPVSVYYNLTVNFRLE